MRGLGQLAFAAAYGTGLLLVLDEPAAALDAPAEHALAVTVFVSHRFSTVGMAGLIVMLGDTGVVEAGTQAQLRKTAACTRGCTDCKHAPTDNRG